MIPCDTDVVVTHGPAYGILDHDLRGRNHGCADLRKRLEAIQPRLHVCGHIHSGRGTAKLGRTVMVNAAICDDDYRPTQPPLPSTCDEKTLRQIYSIGYDRRRMERVAVSFVGARPSLAVPASDAIARTPLTG